MLFSNRPGWSVRRWCAISQLLPILLLAACGQQGAYGPGGRIEIGADGWKWASPRRYYPPPGPPEDPWGPYVREAAARFGVPGRWVRAVMHQESNGEQQATSPVGAMGLMQVMPATYEELRAHYQLGDDPYEPHNNIMAGTAYIKEMYDRFGAPGFLAAYNAGPDRVDSYLAGRASLPDETVTYVAAITPNLGNEVPLSGRFAVASARSGRVQRPTIASLAAGCDVNAAYNPNHPCSILEQAAVQPAPVQTVSAQQWGVNGCDLNAAYDPNHPCTSTPQMAALSAPTRPAVAPPASYGVQLASADGCDPNAAYNPNKPCHPATAVSSASSAARSHQIASATQAAYYPPEKPSPPQRSSHPADSGGDWAIQVGAFANPGLARAVAEGARAQAPHELHSAALALQPTAPFGGKVLYRARLARLSASAATSACTRLNHHQLPCVVVRPNGA
ncbi:MAG: lytic transglycosylase domain-containing protein [Alphaproteobacteria bacterium]|nr:lytic transglycosylase domain-containing protein [Alphaproteobacteria bacterium]